MPLLPIDTNDIETIYYVSTPQWMFGSFALRFTEY